MGARTVTCPTCGQPGVEAGRATFPFCSQRCRAADLGRWLDEAFRIPEPAWEEAEAETGPLGEAGRLLH